VSAARQAEEASPASGERRAQRHLPVSAYMLAVELGGAPVAAAQRMADGIARDLADLRGADLRGRVVQVLERLGIRDLVQIHVWGGEVTLTHDYFDPDEMDGIRAALDAADLEASWNGGQTITVREAR
jgi:hypothetical protein